MKNAVKVLIVEDDKSSGQMLSEVVKRMGFHPIVASKPTDALNIVRLQTVHAAIVDVLLPKMTGVELVIEIRQTKFAENPVIFVSGVFKDKSFANDTLKKTNASAFLFKPFNVDELTAVLTKAMKNVIAVEKWSVQSLLTRKLNSDRERAKAIENLEQIRGLDFPFVLSILMEVGSSGNLNIVDNGGEIFGVSLNKGTITEVDSTESQSTAILALISKGYLSQEDWDEFQKSGARKFSLEKLLSEGIVSPHAIWDAKRDQILYDFQSICTAEKLQVNFVPQEDNDPPPQYAVKLRDLLDLLRSSADDFFPPAYVSELYSTVKDFPIRLVRTMEEMESIWSVNHMHDVEGVKAGILSGGTLATMLAAHPESENRIYQFIHSLVLNRAIMFDDLSRAKNINSMLDRYKRLHEELSGKTADKIFEYFGANANSSPNIIQNIFDEYVKSNNPAQLGKDATPDLKELCKQCFDLVSQAREVLMNDNSKTALLNDLKVKAVEKQQKSAQLMNEGLDLLRKGKSMEAYDRLKEAETLHQSARLTFISAWAEIKAGGFANRPRLHELAKKLEASNTEERKSAFYYMASGLIKRHLGDPTSPAMFEKAMQIDPEFVEARRELHSMNTAAASKAGETKKSDLFTGDITEIVSQIFRRKAD